MADKEFNLTLVFKTEEQREDFIGYWSDGGGEQEYNRGRDEDDELEFDYSLCCTGWGYDPEKHGHPRIVVRD